MSIETDSQLAADSLLPPTHLSLKHKLFDHFDRFQAPFSERRAILISGDLIIVLVAITGAFGLWQLAAERASGQTSDLANLVQGSWYWLPILLGGWYLLAYLNDLYDIPSATYRLVTAVRLSLTGLLFLVLYLAVFFFLPEELPRRFFLYFLLLAMPGIMAWRWFYAALFSISPLQHRLMIVGHGKRAQAIAYSLAQIRNLNYRLVGYVLDQPCLPYARPWGLAELGTVPQLTSLAKSHRVAEIVVANDDNLSPEVFQQLIECQARGVRVSLMPELYEKLYHKVPIEHIDLYWALQVMQDRPVFNRIQLILKR
nr:hypothetical protein [Anaerolineae bacterium]